MTNSAYSSQNFRKMEGLTEFVSKSFVKDSVPIYWSPWVLYLVRQRKNSRLHRNPPTRGSERGVRVRRSSPRKTTNHNNPAHPPKRKPQTAQRTRTKVRYFSPSPLKQKKMFLLSISLPPSENLLNIQQKTTLSI